MLCVCFSHPLFRSVQLHSAVTNILIRVHAKQKSRPLVSSPKMRILFILSLPSEENDRENASSIPFRINTCLPSTAREHSIRRTLQAGSSRAPSFLPTGLASGDRTENAKRSIVNGMRYSAVLSRKWPAWRFQQTITPRQNLCVCSPLSSTIHKKLEIERMKFNFFICAVLSRCCEDHSVDCNAGKCSLCDSLFGSCSRRLCR